MRSRIVEDYTDKREFSVLIFWHLFWNPDIVQVHHLDILAAPAISAAGTSEGHGAFSATVEIVSGMIQIFLCKQGSIFRVIQVESDGTEIVAQSGAECLMELRFLVGNPIAAAVFNKNLSGRIKGKVHLVPGTGIADLLDPFVSARPQAAIGFTTQVDMFNLPGGKGRFNVNGADKRRKVHALVPGGDVPQDGPALVKGALVLTGYIQLHILISFTPVGRTQ